MTVSLLQLLLSLFSNLHHLIIYRLDRKDLSQIVLLFIAYVINNINLQVIIFFSLYLSKISFLLYKYNKQ